MVCTVCTYSGYYVAGFEQRHPSYRCGAYMGKGRWKKVRGRKGRQGKKVRGKKKKKREVRKDLLDGDV